MNLLTDPWIPVLKGRGGLERIGYREFLCGERAHQVGYPRDDMEFASLQLLICLTQILFASEDRQQWRQCLSRPLPEADFDTGVKPHLEHFDLRHPDFPFMQTRGVKAAKVTSVQKLFAGMLSGRHNTFFNRADDLPCCCGPCAALALFNQAVNSPSFGGGFKGTLRGGSPLTTLVAGSDSQQTVWLNVLCKDRLTILADDAREAPVWVEPLRRGATIQTSSIGWKRGLLWQPAHLELQWSDEAGACPACGQPARGLVTGFTTEKFNYTLKGNWPHPHGPRKWRKSGKTIQEYFDSFTTTAPSWTHMTEMLVAFEDEAEGNTPAAVIRQYRQHCLAQPLHLMVGGYRNNQATIEERRHELISLSRGWQDNLPHLRRMIHLALQVKEALRRKSFAFGKDVGAAGLPVRAQALYYQQSESIVYETLRHIDWRDYAVAQESFVRQLAKTAQGVFDQLTAPYSHSLKMIRSLVKARRGLAGALGKLIREASEAST